MNFLLSFMAWVTAQMHRARPCSGICLNEAYENTGTAETHDGYCAGCAEYFLKTGVRADESGEYR